jgi:hypothetical protein
VLADQAQDGVRVGVTEAQVRRHHDERAARPLRTGLLRPVERPRRQREREQPQRQRRDGGDAPLAGDERQDHWHDRAGGDVWREGDHRDERRAAVERERADQRPQHPRRREQYDEQAAKAGHAVV